MDLQECVYVSVCVRPVWCCPHVAYDSMFFLCPQLACVASCPSICECALTCTCLCVYVCALLISRVFPLTFQRVCVCVYACAYVCVSLPACLTRVSGPYVTSSLTGPHDRDRGAGRWPRVGLTPPDPQTPAGPVCVCACERVCARPQMP